MDCSCSSTKSTCQSSELLMSSALSHTLWCDFLLHHSICATIPTEGNDYLTCMPVINGVLFPIQAILQACQVIFILLYYFHRVKDKKLSYSACFGNATKSLVFLHSPSQVQFASTLTWPEVNDCSRITSFQSKYIPATQQGLLI